MMSSFQNCGGLMEDGLMEDGLMEDDLMEDGSMKVDLTEDGSMKDGLMGAEFVQVLLIAHDSIPWWAHQMTFL